MAINNELKALPNTSQSSNTKMHLRLKITLALVVLGAAFAFFGFYSHLAEAQTGNTSAAAKPSQQIPKRRSLRKLLPDPELGMPDLPSSQTSNLSPEIVGGVDTSFGASVADGTAQIVGLATQPDGKFLVSGQFASVNGVTRRGIERFNADGTRDTGFNPGGAGANGIIYVIIVLSDGKLMIGGFFTTYNGATSQKVARLNADGTLDPTFTAQGTSLNTGAQDMIIQPDGKILVSSSFTSFNGTARNAVARLNADGTLDTGFNPNVMTGAGAGFVEELILQPDGKIIIGGVFTTVGGTPRNSFARLNTDGTLDNSFNVGSGVQLDDLSPGGVYGAEIQPDGKVLIGGDFDTYNSIPVEGVVRINTDGSRDTSFNVQPLACGEGGGVEFFAVQPNGKVLVAGFCPGTGSGVLRFNTDGSIDPSFTQGITDNFGYVLALQADGKILAGGFFNQFAGTPRGKVVRLNPDGTPDSFSAVLAREALVNTIVRQADGKLLVGGQFGSVNGVTRKHIARLNADGTFDPSFDAGTGPDSPGTPLVYCITEQPDGKILVGGFFTSFNGSPRNHVVRLNANGSIDGTFIYDDAISIVRDIEVRAGGKIVLAGNNFFNSIAGVNSGIVKLNGDGTYDETAVGSGSSGAVTRVIPLTDGSLKAMIVGSFTMYNGTARSRIARINDDGSLDTTFNPGTGANGTVFDAALLPNTQIVIGGAFTSFNAAANTTRMCLLNSNGTVNANFVSGTGFNNTIFALSVETPPGDKILVGGVFSSYNGTAINQLMLINSNGTRDTSFTAQLSSGLVNDVERLFKQPDGTVLVGGRFSGIGGVSRNSIARLNANPTGSCTNIPIAYGQGINGNLNSSSCVVTGPTDVYEFTGTAGQQIAISMDVAGGGGIQPASLELRGVGGTVLVTSNSGTPNARIPVATGFFTLPSTDSYTIRASSPSGTFGDYLLSLSLQPPAICNYTLSQTTTNVSPGGGTFFFDVIGGVGCPTIPAAVGPNSAHIQIVSNTGGRVTFSVSPHTGGSSRTGTITVDDGGGVLAPEFISHTIVQTGIDPPGNNFFEAGQVLPGMSGVVSGYNTNATAEGGEPTHAGNTAVRSVWYKWTAPTSDLYSFTTSGSDFDTVMAIYTGTSVSALTRIGENDDTTTFDQSSKINFRATAGVTYSIAVDGKAGASGNIVLGYSRYRRLFRLYLQNFNGFPSPISPASVTAKRQDNTGPTINGTFVSLGVYEFDLPDDNSPYIATIAGPVGITWVPSTYLIDNTSARFNELMMGASGGGQNQTSNPTNTIPRHFKGYIHGISTTQGLAALRTQIATTGSTSAVPPKSCFDPADPNTIPPELVPGGPNGTMRVRYDCITQPNSTSQIVPNAPSTAFQVPVLNLPVLNSDTGPSSANAITATASETYNISGRALNGANGLSGVDIDISSGSLAARVTTTGDGSYTFANLAPGLVYTLRAARDGFIFQSQTVNLQAPGATVDLTALTCNYTLTGNGGFGGGAGTGQFSVTATTSQACGWTAVRDSNWIDILSGSSVGNGSVQFSVAPNPGLARQGGVTVGNQSFTITQASGCSFTATPAGSLNFPASGGSGGFTVTASDAACSQTTTTNDYCMVNPGAGTTGNAPVSFTINANFGVARSALINIGGQVFTINQAAAAGTHRTRYDFDGDGKADISLYRPGTPIEWYLQQSTNGFFGMQWGGPGDKVVPADYDGDGKTDIAVFRPSEQRWYLANSGGTFPSFVFGLAGDIPTPADYDGDGKADLSVFRPSDGTWYRQNSSNGAFLAFQFGTSGDRPMVGDYDGDGKSDLAVFRPTTNEWYSQNSGNGAINALQFGINGDNPAPADYDGDGKTDVAVFRSSTGYWYWQNSSNGAFPSIQFGLPGDIPVAADYNGDKSADIAVYRPSSGVWYIWSCTINPLNSTTLFGLPTDVPLAFVNE